MEIKNQIKIIEDELIQLRRYFHENPEKSWEEHNTQKKIMEYLDELDVPYIASTKTGVIATIRGKKSDDHIIGIRADIDALPMDDLVDCEYKSKVSGCAHTCGHDTHIAMLLVQHCLNISD